MEFYKTSGPVRKIVTKSVDKTLQRGGGMQVGGVLGFVRV